MPRVCLRLLSAPLVLILVSSPIILIHAQRNGTDTYAITNARIVTVSGPVIERGTVVIRDGLIVAVGANAAVPADARVIDGSGLTVYPGLIDANTSLGIPEPSPTPTPAAGPGAGFLAALQQRPANTAAPNSTQVPGLQPEILAEDLIRPGGDAIETERSAGITTALTAPRTGIWIGQSALINLAGDTPQQMIVRSPVAMHVGFTPLRGGYPGSLLGVFAVLRQMLLDAQRYREAQRIYDSSPRGHSSSGAGPLTRGVAARARRSLTGRDVCRPRTRDRTRAGSRKGVSTQTDHRRRSGVVEAGGALAT